MASPGWSDGEVEAAGFSEVRIHGTLRTPCCGRSVRLTTDVVAGDEILRKCRGCGGRWKVVFRSTPVVDGVLVGEFLGTSE